VTLTADKKSNSSCTTNRAFSPLQFGSRCGLTKNDQVSPPSNT
jgi:hypothetical protein